MLVRGNIKLGTVWNWSIPAIESCPGSTALCRGLCYACRGAYRMPSVDRAHQANWALSKTKHFVSSVTVFINRKQLPVVRIHASGDFDTVRYVKQWREIIKNCPDTQFYAYTRSWRPTGKTPVGLVEGVRELSMLPNMRLWLSCDRETGRPPVWPRSPLAWLMVDDQDVPQYPVELVFRDQIKTTMMKVARGGQICPYEMKKRTKDEPSSVTCSKCRICFDAKRKLLREHDGEVVYSIEKVGVA